MNMVKGISDEELLNIIKSILLKEPEKCLEGDVILLDDDGVIIASENEMDDDVKSHSIYIEDVLYFSPEENKYQVNNDIIMKLIDSFKQQLH